MNIWIIAVKVGVWFKQLIMVPTNLAKIASIYAHFKTQQKFSELQQRLEKAEKCLAKDAVIKTGRMFFDNNVFWAKDENGKIEKSPYCPRCFELDGKAVHLITTYIMGVRIAKCPECKTEEIHCGESQ